MATKIQLRRDLAANWTSTNPTLSEGELGYETDTDKVKVGDGTTAWTSLSYLIDGTAGAGGVALTDLSVTIDVSASGGGGLSYDSLTGIFTFSPAEIPTSTSALTNDSGYVTGSAISSALSTASTVEDVISALSNLGI
jgi:hypothetical protein